MSLTKKSVHQWTPAHFHVAIAVGHVYLIQAILALIIGFVLVSSGKSKTKSTASSSVSTTTRTPTASQQQQQPPKRRRARKEE
jgi:hypothetical protein